VKYLFGDLKCENLRRVRVPNSAPHVPDFGQDKSYRINRSIILGLSPSLHPRTQVDVGIRA
jgi:hypothetical protein